MELHTLALDLVMAQFYIRGSTLRFILTTFLPLCWSLSCAVLQPKYQVTYHNSTALLVLWSVMCQLSLL